MMKLSIPIMFLLLGILNGCITHKPFQPPRNLYEIWSKPDATMLGTKKALLECGMSDPMNGSVKANGHFDLNGYVLAERCMESLGYIEDNFPACTKSSSTPACQPSVEIPKPSVERRLNSEYCKYARSLIDPVEYQRCLKEDAG